MLGASTSMSLSTNIDIKNKINNQLLNVSKIVIKEVEIIFFVIGLSLPQVTEKIGRS